jgi:hypothetical protein
VVLSGNQALDPAGTLPAVITFKREKVTGGLVKNFQLQRDINPAEAAKYILFCFSAEARPVETRSK